jgi:hypothetical protein
MKAIALLILVAAWGCLLFAPAGTASRVLQMVVFGALGGLLTPAGAFDYWWSSNMLPSKKSAFILICGLGTLASQAKLAASGGAGRRRRCGLAGAEVSAAPARRRAGNGPASKVRCSSRASMTHISNS